jgi:hypothetical protein
MTIRWSSGQRRVRQVHSTLRQPPRQIVASLVAIASAYLLCAGCAKKPVAPALDNEPVYRNAAEGFRFLVPEGWVQTAKANLPGAPSERGQMLVHYDRMAAGRTAMLEVMRVDLPDSADLSAFLSGASYGASSWGKTGSEDIEVGGVTGRRFDFSGKVGGQLMVKEVEAVRRGSRVYLFSSVFTPKDSAARDEFRRAVASAIWEK